jgi:hypothetical protein
MGIAHDLPDMRNVRGLQGNLREAAALLAAIGLM